MKNIYFPDFSCTHGRMCVYGRYAPATAEGAWRKIVEITGNCAF